MKILIIRTIQCELLEPLMNSVEEEYPRSEIFLLDNGKQAAFLQAQKRIKKIFFTKKKGDYGLGNISRITINGIRNEHFNCVVVPHKQYNIAGFENIIFLLVFLGIKNWLHCSIDWKLRHIRKSYLFRVIAIQLLAMPLFLCLLPICLSLFLFLFMKEKIFRIKPLDIAPWKCELKDVHVKN